MIKKQLILCLSVLFLKTTGAKLKSFEPSLIHNTYDVYIKTKEELGINRRVTRQAQSDSYLEKATLYVKDKFGYLPDSDYSVKKHYRSDDGVAYVYLRQLVLGREVFNADMNINLITHSGKVLSAGNSFSKHKVHPDDGRIFDQEDSRLAEYLEIALNKYEADHTKSDLDNIKQKIVKVGDCYKYSNETNNISDLNAQLGWLQINSELLVPVWSFDIQLSVMEWFNVVVSLKSKEVLSLNDWANEVTYRVFPISQFESEDGERMLIKDPFDKQASRLGWHNYGKAVFKYTRGNNVYAKVTSKVNPNPKRTYLDEKTTYSGADDTYDFELKISESDPQKYKDASLTNMFYTANMMHDILYRYGFDEEAGNFQETNFGLGGLGNDAVQAYAQNPSRSNSAAFMTPPDGKAPILLMDIYKSTTPVRDLALENSIIIHEYGHGLSNRLVGGAATSSCLSTLESKGMGEGWSDILAVMMSMKEGYGRDKEFGMKTFASTGSNGVRPSKYSLDLRTNNVTYKSLSTIKRVHDVGHVWASMLYEVYWNLVDKLQFTSDWLGEGADAPASYGNTLMLKLIIKSMKLMPCKPTFIDARNNMISADLVDNKGSNECEIWKGFSKRGLGIDAQYKLYVTTTTESVYDSKLGWETHEPKQTYRMEYTDNYDIPSNCK